MNYVGDAGEANGFVITPLIEKSIEQLSARKSVFLSLMRDLENREERVKTVDIGEKEVDVGNSKAVWLKDFEKGNEARITLGLDLDGMPTHGDHPVRKGNYLDFMHDEIFLNAFRSPEYPLYGEMDQQKFAQMINNLSSYQQRKIAEYMGRWVDFLGLQALFCGADRGLMLDKDGGLGKKFLNATSPGEQLSCMNTYVADHGFVSWDSDRSTYEGNISTELNDLTDSTSCGFNLNEHERHQDFITSVKRYPEVQFGGKNLRAIALADPWLIKRLLNRSSDWMTLLKDADVRGIEKNHAINRDQAVIVDRIMYIPVDWMRAFRVDQNDLSDGTVPQYGAGLTKDPQSEIDSANNKNICPIVYISAGALLAGRGSKFYQDSNGKSQKKGRIWFTGDFDPHGTSGGWAAHMKLGFKRCEWFSPDGSDYMNNKSHVAWYWDPGPGIDFSA